MKRALLIVLCSTIVAAFEGRTAAAAAVAEDVPVPGGAAAVAQTLGLDTVPDRGRFAAELTRVVEGFTPSKRNSVGPILAPLAKQTATELVPVPLTPAVWGDAIFHRRVQRTDLLFAILGDRRASLLCHALAGEDDETLAYFIAHPAVLTNLYELSAAAFGAFGASLRVRGDRVVPPGGDEAIPLWEAVVGQPVSHPDLFVETMFALGEGRIAYLYDTIAILDPDRARFALGLWIADPAVRLERMTALALAWSASFTDWRVKITPFRRQPNDAAATLFRVRADPGGAPASPASRGFWFQVFRDAAQGQVDGVAGELQANASDRPIDAAWVVESIVVPDVRRRADRLDQLAFGQRALASLPPVDLPDALSALRALPRSRTLMWTIERMGVGKPGVYAAAGRLADRMSSLDRVRGFVALAQFQGAMSLLQRMTMVGTLNQGTSERLVTSLIAVPLNEDGRYAGAIARWLDQQLRPAIPAAGTFEQSLIAALSGPSPSKSPAERSIRWEGENYRFDLALAERRRLELVRKKQNSLPIDLAVDLDRTVRMLSVAPIRLEQGALARTQVEAVLDEAPLADKYTDVDAVPPGVASRPDVRDAIAKWIEALDRILAGKDLTRLARVRAGFADIEDEATAQALVSLAYALEIGDPDGATLLAGDVSRRHDFGFALADPERRLRGPWTVPVPDLTPGLAWHIDGSLLGLDVGLSKLGLRRLGMTVLLGPPTLSANERDTFTMSAGLINAFALTDAARDAITDAIAAGRRRVKTLIDNPDGVEAVGDAIGLDGWRRRAARWAVVHDPENLESLFSLGELVILGNLRATDLRPWGMSAIVTSGCLCSDVPTPGRWRILTGRPQLGVLATAVVDLNLHVARMLKELTLPAGLAKYVLSAAVQDFVDEVRPTDEDDWLTLARRGQAVARDRIEDYVAAAAADGPLVKVDP